MRMITASGVNYKIMRDLNWYIPAKTTENGSTLPVSEVKVFASLANVTKRNNLNYQNVRYHSPVEGGNIKVVSFPALKELYIGQSLSASTRNDENELYSINNVQMRAASFNRSTSPYDEAYGLICKNSGTVYNIFTNRRKY